MPATAPLEFRADMATCTPPSPRRDEVDPCVLSVMKSAVKTVMDACLGALVHLWQGAWRRQVIMVHKAEKGGSP